MKRQNPPQSSLDRAREIEKYLSPFAIASMYAVGGIFYIVLISLLFADLVWTTLVKVTPAATTIYAVSAFIPAMFAMLAWFLRPEDPLSRYIIHLAKLWRTPIALPPDSCAFTALMMDGEPICAKLSFYYPEGDQTPATKERLYTYVQAALANDCCMRVKPPSRHQLVHVIDGPLETLAEEYKIPVLYAKVEEVYSMKEGDVHAALARASLRGEFLDVGEFEDDAARERKITALNSTFKDTFRIRASDVLETLASNYGKTIDSDLQNVDIKLDQLEYGALQLLEYGANKSRISVPPAEIKSLSSSDEVNVPAALADHHNIRIEPQSDDADAAVADDHNIRVEVQSDQQPEIVIEQSLGDVARESEIPAPEPEIEVVQSTSEADVHAALTNVCMMLSDIPSLHELDVVVVQPSEDLAEQLKLSVRKSPRRAAAPTREEMLGNIEDIDQTGLSRIADSHVTAQDTIAALDHDVKWLRTGT
jgi:hypothetical protein